jgi:hypothetical protein
MENHLETAWLTAPSRAASIAVGGCRDTTRGWPPGRSQRYAVCIPAVSVAPSAPEQFLMAVGAVVVSCSRCAKKLVIMNEIRYYV